MWRPVVSDLVYVVTHQSLKGGRGTVRARSGTLDGVYRWLCEDRSEPVQDPLLGVERQLGNEGPLDRI